LGGTPTLQLRTQELNYLRVRINQVLFFSRILVEIVKVPFPFTVVFEIFPTARSDQPVAIDQAINMKIEATSLGGRTVGREHIDALEIRVRLQA
jgi:hypothetical protein